MAESPIDKLTKYKKENYNILLPTTALECIPQMHVLSITVVHISPDPVKKEVYQLPGSKEFALTGHALDKIAAAAGVTWVWQACGRIDDGSDPHYCHYRMVGRVRDFDGTIREMPGDKEVDYRDGSPQIIGFTEKQLTQARQHILSLAQSKAAYRALRKLLQIKSSYSKSELAKPFVVPKLVPNPDLRDPEIKKIFAENMIRGMMNLYGPADMQQPSLPQHTPPAIGAGELDEEPDESPDTVSETPALEAPEEAEQNDADNLFVDEEEKKEPREVLREAFLKMDAESQIQELGALGTLAGKPLSKLKKPIEQFSAAERLKLWEFLTDELSKRSSQ
jgi:hypothetical protein